jgi:hypothetical protein
MVECSMMLERTDEGLWDNWQSSLVCLELQVASRVVNFKGSEGVIFLPRLFCNMTKPRDALSSIASRHARVSHIVLEVLFAPIIATSYINKQGRVQLNIPAERHLVDFSLMQHTTAQKS